MDKFKAIRFEQKIFKFKEVNYFRTHLLKCLYYILQLYEINFLIQDRTKSELYRKNS